MTSAIAATGLRKEHRGTPILDGIDPASLDPSAAGNANITIDAKAASNHAAILRRDSAGCRSVIPELATTLTDPADQR